jgi:hypothetical protein
MNSFPLEARGERAPSNGCHLHLHIHASAADFFFPFLIRSDRRETWGQTRPSRSTKCSANIQNTTAETHFSVLKLSVPLISVCISIVRRNMITHTKCRKYRFKLSASFSNLPCAVLFGLSFLSPLLYFAGVRARLADSAPSFFFLFCRGVVYVYIYIYMLVYRFYLYSHSSLSATMV